MAAQAQHVIGGQGQGQFRTAAVEAGNFGMAGKAEGLARFQLGQVFHEFAAGVFFHDAFSCWKVVGAGQCLGKISPNARCPACLYPLPGFAANFFVPEDGLRCRGTRRSLLAGMSAAVQTSRELLRSGAGASPLAGSAGGPCRPFMRRERPCSVCPAPVGENGCPPHGAAPGLRRPAQGLQGGGLSRDGPDARSRPAGCGAGEDGAGLRDADGACCGSRRSPCVRDCPAIAAGRDGRKTGRRTKAAGQSRSRRPHW